MCYTFNSGAPGHPNAYATASGISQALSLTIDVQPAEYYGPFSYDATGIKLILHEQGEWPEVENWGIDVTPGYNTNIRITRHKVITLIAQMKGQFSTYVFALIFLFLYYCDICFNRNPAVCSRLCCDKDVEILGASTQACFK